MEVKRFSIGPWNFAVRNDRSANRFVAWCAQYDDLGQGPLDPPPNIEVYFEFADTAEAAIAKLKREVLH